MPHLRRRDRLRKLTKTADAMLVTNPTNVTYLTGFTGDSSYLVVTGQCDPLISDPRYEQQIGEESTGLSTFIRKPGELLMDVTCEQLRKLDLKTLIIESGSMTVQMFDQLQAAAGIENYEKGNNQVESLRAIKDAGEIAAIASAVEIAQRAFSSIRAQLSARQTEREVAHELERIIRHLGGEGCSFKPIVAVGPRAALPHAVAGKSQMGDSSHVLIDWGATFCGYRSDLTRVLMTSKIPAKIARAYEAVLAAQTAAIAAMRAGIMVSQIDAVAREVIAQARMAKQFNHGLGHGIGLDIHEAPRLGKNPDQPLEEGMVVTVEPGVYFPGLGGIRIEDDVLIEKDGCRVLSSLGRTIEENQVALMR